MFKIKRPAIVGLLVVLLLFISFLNYQLTQQSILKASKDYQEFELSEMETNHTNVFNEELPEEEVDDSEELDIEQENDENIEENPNDLEEVVSTRDEDIADVIEGDDDNYFVNFRLSRDKIRAESIDRLNDIVNNEMTKQEVRSEAQDEIINIGRITEKELQVEGLIKSKGFKDSLVFLTSEDIKIVVLSEELKEEEMVKILDIVKSETSISMENIKIMKKH